MIPEFVRTVGARSACVILCGLLTTGCISQRPPEPASIPRPDPPPSAEAVQSAYNARVTGADRLWARAILRFQTVDRDGNDIDEQGEGHLQIVQPRKLYLTVGKLGDTGYELGSNDQRFWWIDVRAKSARVGEHDTATREQVARAGLPVHPLELLELLGVTPIWLNVPDGAGVPEWSRDGRTLDIHDHGGRVERVVRLDPDTFLPVMIELRDFDGSLIARSELKEYEPLIVGGNPSPTARVATRVFVDVPRSKTQVTLWLRDPENKGAKIRDRAFDFEALCREFGVSEVRTLDGLTRGETWNVPGGTVN